MKKIEGFAYDLHVHTNQGSLCGKSSGAMQALAYKKAGFAGIVITDHFFNGNCAVDRSLSWEEKVARFCLGYEDALIAGQMVDLDVFFGFEWNYEGAEFLIYGLTPDWLYAHENCDTYSVAKLYKEVHDAGGLMFQAHPYRDDWYIKQVKIYPGLCDGIEMINLGNEFRNPDYNHQAVRLAKRGGYRVSVGSDSHHEASKKAGLLFKERISSDEELVYMLSKGQDQPKDLDDWYVINSEISYRI